MSTLNGDTGFPWTVFLRLVVWLGLRTAVFILAIGGINNTLSRLREYAALNDWSNARYESTAEVLLMVLVSVVFFVLYMRWEWNNERHKSTKQGR